LNGAEDASEREAEGRDKTSDREALEREDLWNQGYIYRKRIVDKREVRRGEI
jgi:hypothetical protein